MGGTHELYWLRFVLASAALTALLPFSKILVPVQKVSHMLYPHKWIRGGAMGVRACICVRHLHVVLPARGSFFHRMFLTTKCTFLGNPASPVPSIPLLAASRLGFWLLPWPSPLC